MPALVVLFGIGIHTAEGTSLLVMIPNAIIASLAHLRQGTAAPQIGFGLAAFAVPGTVIGAVIGLTLAPVLLSAIFGLYLLLIAGREVWRLRSAHPTTAGPQQTSVRTGEITQLLSNPGSATLR